MSASAYSIFRIIPSKPKCIMIFFKVSYIKVNNTSTSLFQVVANSHVKYSLHISPPLPSGPACWMFAQSWALSSRLFCCGCSVSAVPRSCGVRAAKNWGGVSRLLLPQCKINWKGQVMEGAVKTKTRLELIEWFHHWAFKFATIHSSPAWYSNMGFGCVTYFEVTNLQT